VCSAASSPEQWHEEEEEEEEEEVCVCVCVCGLLIKAASSTWGHRYGAVYTVTSDQHPCHSYD
jgi:hypothetical protein